MRILKAASLAAALAIGLAQAGFAADMPVKAPVYKAPMVAPVYNWTGFYLGGHVGGAWSNADAINSAGGFLPAPAGTTIGIDGAGVLGGFQLGFNWQTGNWVFGVQGDMSWTGINPASDPFPGSPTTTLNYKTDWLATVTGRIGYAWNNVLLYGKGGGAWVHNKYDLSDPTVPFDFTGSDTRSGWTAGAGLEYGFTPNWTAFIEYDHIDLGAHSITAVDPANGSGTADFKQNINIVKGGINYKFGALR